MDESGLFFKDTTRKTFHIKGQDCAGGKRSKERITIALCASMTGEKLQPLVIGKCRKPRCFQKLDPKTLPVIYRFNKKAWMTSAIYEEWLKLLNKQMTRQNRKILLFVDNAPSHPALTLSNITVKFFPPNTTSKTQPMDQGIIQTVKLKFRKRQMIHMVKEMERQPDVSGPDLLKQINILDAIYWLSSSWKETEASTIEKCFLKAGFISDTSQELTQELHAESCDDLDDDDIPLAVLKLSMDLFGCEFNELKEIDETLATCDNAEIDWTKPAHDLLSDINEQGETDDESEEEDMILSQFPNNKELLDCVNKIKTFSVHRGCSKLLKNVFQMEELISCLIVQKERQSSITDFFTPRGSV
ncbi:tigger transposable element-derived protein 4-like [Saccostrea cucullata]|uniref:tigger transposable element-derived protein 4-like n=1 Tax=Saccostrea cuccullata TaxID=36930 RepID=UPI002ED30755